MSSKRVPIAIVFTFNDLDDFQLVSMKPGGLIAVNIPESPLVAWGPGLCSYHSQLEGAPLLCPAGVLVIASLLQ